MNEVAIEEYVENELDGMQEENDYMDDDYEEYSDPQKNIRSEGKSLDFPIDINIQLGNIIMNSKEAESMERGDIIKLETNHPGEVSLIFQGREIGRGKLVDVDGYLAVQITQNWCRS